MKNYSPKPIDTSKIVLPDDILDIAEFIARNTHEVWARQRIEDGWVYGEVRDDEKKTHPCIVPYEQLSESEKQYDRNTSSEVLKVLYAMGYKLIKK